MPNWKKVVVSGSDAVLNSITASAGISSSGFIHAQLFVGNLFGNAHSATSATTAILATSASTISTISTDSNTTGDYRITFVPTTTEPTFNTLRIDDDDLRYTPNPGILYVPQIYTTGDITSEGNIIANQYIVSSSVYHTTQSFSSGSTIFGDDQTDTHQFTGSLYITGNIDVSNNITADSIILSDGGEANIPAIRRSSDSNTGIYFPAPDNMALQAGGGAAEITLNGTSGVILYDRVWVQGPLTASAVSSSGALFASLSLDNSNYNAVMYDTTNGKFYYTDSAVLTSLTASAISASYIDLDPIPEGSEPAWKEGRIFYSAENGALSVYNSEAGITLQVGQEFWKKAKNGTSNTILNGTPVRISGSNGQNPLIFPAVAEDYTVGDHHYENHIIGIATHGIGGNAVGFITEKGIVNDIDTSMFGAGDTLYLQTSSAGFRNTPPPFPYDIVQVGTVIRSHTSAGSIEVNPREPIHFGIISGLSGSVSGPGDLWVYQDNQAWTPTKTLTGSYDITGSLDVSQNVNATTISATDAYIEKSLTLQSSIVFEVVSSTITTDALVQIENFNANSVIYEYSLTDTNNGYGRTGQIMVVYSNGNLEYTEVSTADVGNDPNPPELTVAVSTGLSLRVQNGGGYRFRALRKTL